MLWQVKKVIALSAIAADNEMFPLISSIVIMIDYITNIPPEKKTYNTAANNPPPHAQ